MTDYLTTYQGTMGGSEIFVHTMPVISSLTQAQVAGVIATQFAATWATAAAGFTNLFGSEVSYDHVTAAEILDPFTGALFAATSVDVTADGTGSQAAYTGALAVSIIGGTRPNGTPLRGRFYLPTAGANIVTGGTLPLATVQDAVNFVDSWFANLVGNGVQPAVWSRKLGVVQAMTSGNIGNVPDVIRSRRNGLSEARTALSV